MNEVTDKICEERRKRIDEKLETHERRLNAHAVQLDELTKSDAVNTVSISNLCEKIDGLINTIKWLIGILIVPILGGIIGFFFYAAQRGLIK